MNDRLDGLFEDLNEDDRLFVRSVILETVAGITVENAVIWGFSKNEVEEFRLAMNGDDGPKP